MNNSFDRDDVELKLATKWNVDVDNLKTASLSEPKLKQLFNQSSRAGRISTAIKAFGIASVGTLVAGIAMPGWNPTYLVGLIGTMATIAFGLPSLKSIKSDMQKILVTEIEGKQGAAPAAQPQPGLSQPS